MITEKLLTSEDGTEISYSVTGQGRPLILCNGIGCDPYAWKYLAPHFSDRYQIIRWNYRGHGRSKAPKDPSRVRVEDLLGDLKAIVDQERLRSVVLVGHSMGVQVALDYALTFPDDVSAAVTICGAQGRPMATFHDNDLGHRALPHLTAAVHRFPRIAKKLWSTLLDTRLAYEIAVRFEVNGAFVTHEDFMPYFRHISRVDPALFFRMLTDLNAHDLADRLGDLKLPTLIVAGEKDTFTPAWISRKMHEKIPNSEFLFIPGGSHTAPIEFPELINLRVEKFLNERLSPPVSPRDLALVRSQPG